MHLSHFSDTETGIACLTTKTLKPNTISQMINKFTKSTLDDIKEKMQLNIKYKNNIVRYLDIIFPQLLIMYNNMLYFYAQSYRNNWSYDENENLKNLLYNNNLYDTQFKLPILKNFDADLLKSSIKFNYIVESTNKNERKIQSKNKQKESMVNVLESLKKELTMYKTYIRDYISRLLSLTSVERSNYENYGNIVKQIEIKINYIVSQQNTINREIISLRNVGTKLSVNTKTERKKLAETMEKEIKKIHFEDKQLPHTLVSVEHENIFNNIQEMHNKIITDIGSCDQNICSDYILYNELWKKYIDIDYNPIDLHVDTKPTYTVLLQNILGVAYVSPPIVKKDTGLDDITNIHLKNVLFETELINDMDKITRATHKDAKILHEKFEKINKFYDKILVNTINASNELPYYYNYKENYYLAETLDIITHIVKHVLCSNLYYTVIKILTKYLIELNRSFTNDNKSLKTDIYDKLTLKKSKLVTEIHNYILIILPKLLVKKFLDIYENDYEETTINIDKLFFILVNTSLTESFIFFTCGYNVSNLVVSNILFDLSDNSIVFCSSKLKFSQVNFSSIISFTIVNISLCEITPGLVKLIVPTNLFFAISIIIGNNSGNTVMELYILHIFLYVIILLIKFFGELSNVIGILILIFKTSFSYICINLSVNPLTVE
jgi:hypothetical protein